MKTFLRILVIGAILLILIFLSIGLVKIVPKAISSLASATVSIGSIFDKKDTAVEPASSATSTATSTGSNGGFIVISSSTPSGTNGVSNGTNGNTDGNATTSLLDLLNPKFGSYPYNNYVPTPAGTPRNDAGSSNTKPTNSTGNSNTNSAGSASGASYASCTGSAQPDLAITILNRGVINSAGQFVETNNFTTSDTVTVKFKVENRGLCSTGSWNFRADMPSSNATDQVRTIANAGSLPAGSAVTGQATFDSPRAGTSNIVLTVTPANGRDANTSNNTATSQISVTNTGTGNGGTVVNPSGDGRADLTVRILQTGTLTANNQFIPTGTAGSYGSVRAGERAAVKFEIVNQGYAASGAWNFRADLTGTSPRTYNNPNYEASIPAGGKATYTIAFDNLQYGSNMITIYADSLNQVNEFNESNNTASAQFNVSY